MSWDEYIKNLMAKDFVMDAALVGHKAGAESVWASTPGGKLSGITVGEYKGLNYALKSYQFIIYFKVGSELCIAIAYRNYLHYKLTTKLP